MKKCFCLFLRQFYSTALHINRKLFTIQSQLFYTNLVNFAAQTQNICRRKKLISPCNNQMDISRQSPGKHTQKSRCTAICQQMKIINKNVTTARFRQFMTHILYQQSCSCNILRTGIILQKIKTRPFKSHLYTFPENSQVVRIHTDTDQTQCIYFPLFIQKPVDGCCLSISHGSHHRCQRTTGNRTQTRLQPF